MLKWLFEFISSNFPNILVSETDKKFCDYFLKQIPLNVIATSKGETMSNDLMLLLVKEGCGGFTCTLT